MALLDNSDLMKNMMRMSLLGNVSRMGQGLLAGRNWQEGLAMGMGGAQMPSMGDMLQMQLAMQQMKQQQAQQQAMSQLAANPSLMGSPEGASLMMQAAPQAYIQGAIKQQFAAPPRPTERDKLRADLETAGYRPEQIREFMINRDRYQLQTDMFGNRTIFDRYSGQPIGGMAPPAGGEAFEQTAQAPAGVPTLSKGFEAGTGASGFFGNIANTITDAMGAGLIAPQAEQAKTALDTLKTRTMLQMTAAMPGRPSDLIRQRLEGLAVTPGSLFTGDERALTRLEQTRGLIGEEMTRLQSVLDNPEGYKADDLAAARANMSQLGELQETYDHIIRNWRPGSAGTSGQPMEVRSKTEYDKLPSGTRFIAPDGTIRVKP